MRTFKPLWYQGFEFGAKIICAVGAVRAAPPVEAVLQSFADGAEVSGVCHHSAIQRVVPQINR